jgi:hypothetical protein
MTYQLQGRMVESCSCDVICPCWVGGDPDGGTCAGTIAWRVDAGTIDGVDVSGLTVAAAVQIPGNALKGNWRAVLFVDDKASTVQADALTGVFSGQRGGPVAELAQLVGEVVSIERVPITFELEQGQGRLQIGSPGGAPSVVAEVEALKGASGAPTTLSDAAFSVIPGAPYFIGRTRKLRQAVPGLGHDFQLESRSTVQGAFRFEAP